MDSLVEWLKIGLSGYILVALGWVFAFLAWLFFRNKKKSSMTQKAGNKSTQYQSGGDMHIGKKDD